LPKEYRIISIVTDRALANNSTKVKMKFWPKRAPALLSLLSLNWIV